MRKILVLDDDQAILDLLRTVLADAGYEPLVAAGPNAMHAHTSADLVLTDLIPLKAYRRDAALRWLEGLRARFAAPIVVITAHAEAAAEPDMLGADAIITKPFDVDQLLGTIEEVLG